MTGYNATVHSSSGIAPARFTDSDVLAIWKRLQRKNKQERIIKDFKGDSQDPEARVRTGRFEQSAHRRKFLPGRADASSRHETDAI